MTEKVFRLIDAINRSGVDNSQWGVIADCEDTKREFGTTEVRRLEGKWLYLYTDNDGRNVVTDWNTQVIPDSVLQLDDCFTPMSRICFYKLED